MNQELNAIILPNGILQLEWSESEEEISKSTHALLEEIHKRFTPKTYSWLLYSGFSDPQAQLSPSLAFWRDFSSLFTRKLTKIPDLETLRHQADVLLTDEECLQILEGSPMMTGAEYLSPDLIREIWKGLNACYQEEIKRYPGSVQDFVKTFSSDLHLVGRVFFHLVESKDGEQPFAFLATYSTRLNDQGKSKHLPLKFALQEYGKDDEKLLEMLATVYLAAKKSELIASLLESGELFHPLAWPATEALLFLKEVSLYEESGILCRIPNWWKGSSSSLKMNISIGDTKPSFVGMDEILDFRPRLLIGDMDISMEEAQQYLAESEGLAFIKNRWVAVDPEKLRQTLDAYEKANEMMKQDGISLRDALRLLLNPEKILGDPDQMDTAAISAGEWLESVMKKMKNPDLTPSVDPGEGFQGNLREYQQQGLNWLYFMHSLNFGACLADDMGLGKTVQILAFLSVLSASTHKRTALLVIPASLISNWVGEIERFFPTLKYFVAHPEAHQTKSVKEKDATELDSLDLVLTTYTMSKKYAWLQSYPWSYVILDEAQAIKNPGAKQTKSVKLFNARNRIVMTGTPIENRLSDLWSLFDFLNPGLLGNKAEFGRFCQNLKKDTRGYARLRKVTGPYILRRLKTDRKVISDLPNKVEMKTYADLSKKQIVLYQNLVAEIASYLETSDGIQRKGMILASLMKFKQLCNHPDQFLGNSGYMEAESGKFERLREICETIHEKREKALVFTQFKEITEPLSIFLENIFQRSGLVLHGSVPVGKRKELISRFQSDEYVPFMVLSLKAGGVGLNLTQANHVIHFDRWWNPAVENQATDRAFRIGQRKNVLVHKFITKGTIEEKIDAMLEEKARLSGEVIAESGETWITEMENDKLLKLFTLTL